MRNKSNQTKYYRIIDDPIRYESSSQANPAEFKHLLSSLSTRNKYLYIDINASTPTPIQLRATKLWKSAQKVSKARRWSGLAIVSSHI